MREQCHGLIYCRTALFESKHEGVIQQTTPLIRTPGQQECEKPSLEENEHQCVTQLRKPCTLYHSKGQVVRKCEALKYVPNAVLRYHGSHGLTNVYEFQEKGS